MDEYREFISTFRELELKDAYFLLHENMTPIFTKYVKMVRNLKFGDGTYYTYYFDLKKIITSYHSYFIEKMDKTIKDVDRYTQIITIGKIVELCDKTIEKYEQKQQTFEYEFLPVRSPAEKECYERIKKKMAVFVKKLNAMSEAVQVLDKQFKVEAFTRKVMPASIQGDYEKFNYTHQFLSRMCAARVTYIDTSISEINIRVCHIFKKYQSQCEGAINSLLHQLYNVNKESLRLQRRHRRFTIDHEEVNKTIQLIRQRIDEFYPQDMTLRQLQEEVQYWTEKSQEIDYIATALAIIKSDQKQLEKIERRILLHEDYCSCYSEKLEEIPEDEMIPIDQLKKRQEDLKTKYDEVARCLFTFFCVRGKNRIYYRDNIGQYYIDVYGHKVYSFGHGLEMCHMLKDGTFEDLEVVEQKFFNEYGYYVYEESIGSRSLSTISLSLTSQESFFVDSSDNALKAQNSIARRSTARIDRRGIFNIDIRNKLDEGTVRYLWDVFGSILPDALFEVYSSRPKNPIQFLAHSLLKHKYSKNSSEIKAKKEEAEEYRIKQNQEAHVKSKAEALNWRSKMPKHCKVDDVYENDIQNLFIDATANQHDFILGSMTTY